MKGTETSKKTELNADKLQFATNFNVCISNLYFTGNSFLFFVYVLRVVKRAIYALAVKLLNLLLILSFN